MIRMSDKDCRNQNFARSALEFVGLTPLFVIRVFVIKFVFIRVDEWLEICSLLTLLRFGRLRCLCYRIHLYRRFAIHTHRSHDTRPVAALLRSLSVVRLSP